METRRFLLIATIASFLAFLPRVASAQTKTQTQSPAALTGQVTSTEEGPMEGVLVTAKKTGSTIALCLSAPAFAYTASGVDDATKPGIDNPGLDVTRHAMPPPDVTANPAETPTVAANPLWAIPLSALAATRTRPLFTPSRRPPAPVVASVPVAAPRPPRTAAGGAAASELDVGRHRRQRERGYRRVRRPNDAGHGAVAHRRGPLGLDFAIG